MHHLEWPSPCSVFNVTLQYPGRLLLLSMVTLAAARSLPAQVTDGSTSDEYRRTLQALEHYRVLASEDDGETLPATKKPVEPGDHYAGVPRLIRLLTRLGDLPAEARPADTDLYSGALVAAVKRFQTRHGLEPDGRTRQRHARAIEHTTQLPGSPARTGVGAMAADALRSLASGDRAESSRIPVARVRPRPPARARNEDRDRAGPQAQDSAFVFGGRDGHLPSVLERAPEHSAQRAGGGHQTGSFVYFQKRFRAGHSPGRRGGGRRGLAHDAAAASLRQASIAPETEDPRMPWDW